MIDENEEVQGANTWTFLHTDAAGVTTSSSFESETWPFVLQQFVNFLKGSGFGVTDESIGVNGNNHLSHCDDVVSEAGWYGEVFYPEKKESADDSGDEQLFSQAIREFLANDPGCWH